MASNPGTRDVDPLRMLADPIRIAVDRTWGSLTLSPAAAGTLDAVRQRYDSFLIASSCERLMPVLALGILDALLRQWHDPVGALLLGPHAEVLTRWEAALEPICRELDLGVFAWHQGVDSKRRRAFFDNPAHLLLITPGGLDDLLLLPAAEDARVFRRLRFIAAGDLTVLAAGDGGAHLLSLLERVVPGSWEDVQRVGLAGPIGSPKALAQWFQGSSKRLLSIKAEPVRLALDFIEVDVASPADALQAAARRAAVEENSAVMVAGPAAAAAMAREVATADGGRPVVDTTSRAPMTGDRPPPARVLHVAPPGSARALLLQLAALGWVGRPTAGRLIFYTGDDEQMLAAIALANLLDRGAVEGARLVERAGYVLTHQILAETLQHQNVTRQYIWQQLRRAGGFAHVSPAEFSAVVDGLVQANALTVVEGLLGTGTAGTKTFDRSVYRRLGETFPPLPLLQTTSTAVGPAEDPPACLSLFESWFVLAFGTGPIFTVDGQRWAVQDVDFEAGRALILPDERNLRSSWHGRPQLWSRLLAEEVRSLLLADRQVAFLWPDVTDRLTDMRKTWRPMLAGVRFPVRVVDGGVILATFAGGRINALLARALTQVLGAPTIVDNLGILVRLDPTAGSAVAEVRHALRTLGQPGFFSPRFLAGLVGSLPRGPFSLFGPYLPVDLEASFFAEAIFDLPGTTALLGELLK